jgi:hypothetical protein
MVVQKRLLQSCPLTLILLNDHPLVLQNVGEAFKASTFNAVKLKDGIRNIPRLTNHGINTDWIGPDHLPKHATSEWGEEMQNPWRHM